MGAYTWVLGSWRGHLPLLVLCPLLSIMAVVCGSILGGERERREKPAGLRTLAMVCLGSAVFTMLSYVFVSTTEDSGRVAAQIVTGIGFLGAGVILHGRRIVTGVTTAAIIWVVAAIGMAVGAGYAVAGFGLSLLVNRVLVLVALYETKWHPDLREVRVEVEYRPNGGLTQIRLERVLADYQVSDRSAEWCEISADRCRMKLSARLAPIHLYELLSEMAEVPDVVTIQRQIGPAPGVAPA